MGKHKAGLHKKVSSIFGGAPVPKSEEAVPVMAKSVPAFVPPAPKVAPPKASAPVVTPSLPQAAKAPLPVPPPMPAPRSEPAVAPIKHYKLDSEEAVAGETLWSRARALVNEKLLAPREGVDRKRQLVAAAMIPLLIVVLVLVVPGLFETPGRVKPAGDEPAIAAAAVSAGISWKFPEPYATGLRDPMKPFSSGVAGTVQADIGDLVLSGIVFSADKRSAIIGTRMMHEGDKVLVNTGESVVEFQITSIREDAVEYEAQGAKWRQEPGREMRMITGAA